MKWFGLLAFGVTLSAAAPTPATSAACDPGSPDPEIIGDFQGAIGWPVANEVLAPSLILGPSKNDATCYQWKTKQIGSNVFNTYDFNSTHAGKVCRFHFALSYADGGNQTTDTYQDVFETASPVTLNTTSATVPEVRRNHTLTTFWYGPFGSSFSDKSQSSFFPRHATADGLADPFPCPSQTTTYWTQSRGNANGTLGAPLVNWSWNHGLVVEVCDDADSCAPEKDFGEGGRVVIASS